MTKDIREDNVQNSETMEETVKMSNDDKKNLDEQSEIENQGEEKTEDLSDSKEEMAEPIEQEGEQETDELEKLKDELQESKDKHLRLYSEFENFRRRTAKERLELIKNANEDLLVSLLPVLDDFERAYKSFEQTDDSKVMKEGFELIYNKFKGILQQKGLKPLEEAVGSDFDSELHEAIAQTPAPEKKLKGKIIDVIERGYLLHEKVIRFAKVVIGS